MTKVSITIKAGPQPKGRKKPPLTKWADVPRDKRTGLAMRFAETPMPEDLFDAGMKFEVGCSYDDGTSLRTIIPLEYMRAFGDLYGFMRDNGLSIKKVPHADA